MHVNHICQVLICNKILQMMFDDINSTIIIMRKRIHFIIKIYNQCLNLLNFYNKKFNFFVFEELWEGILAYIEMASDLQVPILTRRESSGKKKMRKHVADSFHGVFKLIISVQCHIRIICYDIP